MTTEVEKVKGSEEVTYIKRRMPGVPPDDTRCRAKKGKSRCKEDIVWDEEGTYWSVFCETHHAKDPRTLERVDR